MQFKQPRRDVRGLDAVTGKLLLASPSQAVKAGRKRGLSVLDRLRMEEQSSAAEAMLVTAKRRARSIPKKAREVALADPSLPNGVGIQGRGRAAMNIVLEPDSNSLVAMQERQQSLLAAAEFRSMRTVLSVSPAGAGKFDDMPDRDDYMLGTNGEAQFASDVRGMRILSTAAVARLLS